MRGHQVERIGHGVLDSDQRSATRIAVLGARILIRRAGPVRVPHTAIDSGAIILERAGLAALPDERRIAGEARPAILEDRLQLLLGRRIEERLLQCALAGNAPPSEIVKPRPVVSAIDVLEGGVELRDGHRGDIAGAARVDEFEIVDHGVEGISELPERDLPAAGLGGQRVVLAVKVLQRVEILLCGVAVRPREGGFAGHLSSPFCRFADFGSQTFARRLVSCVEDHRVQARVLRPGAELGERCGVRVETCD